MLVMLLRDNEPGGMAVAFDRPEPTFRDDIVEEYKGNRPDTPDLLIPQFSLVREVLGALGIVMVEKAGYEADDILATLATQARDAGRNVVVVSGDRDTFQLVEDPLVKVMYTRRGISDTVVYDEAGIMERHGVSPKSYPTLAALRGDTSDNLPGVPGVGEKTAAKLVSTYGDLDTIFDHVQDQTPKLRQNLAEHEDQVRRNAEVIPLVRDVALEVTLDDLALGKWDPAEVKRVFGELEMRSAWQRLAPLLGGDAEEALPRAAGTRAPPSIDLASIVASVPAHAAAAVEFLGAAAQAKDPVALAPVWSGDAGRSPLVGLALVAAPAAGDGADAGGPPTWLDEGLLADPGVLSAIGALVGPGGAPLVAHGAKELMRSLAPLGIDVRSLALDTAVAAYLLDPSSGRYRLEDVVEVQLGLALDAEVEAEAAGQLALDGGAEVEVSTLAARNAVALGLLLAPMREALVRAGLERLHDEVERPLVRVLARMEVAGIRVDTKELRRIADGLVAECARLEAVIHELAGETFNVNSTPQLRTVLYDRLGLTPGKKTKTGFSTDAQTLEKLRGQHPIVDTLLSYREVEKLRSTYGETLIAEVADGRAYPRHLRPDRGPHRPAVVGPAQPPQHPRAHRGRAPPSARLHPRRRMPSARGRLRPDRAARHRPSVARSRARGRLRRGTRHPPHHRRQRVRRRPRGRDLGPAQPGQDGLVRPRLRDGGLRPRPTLVDRAVRGRSDPRRLLRGVPCRARLHGQDGGRSPLPRLHRDLVRSTPTTSGPLLSQPQPPYGGRAPGHERRHPGPGRRPVQGGPGPSRCRPRGEGARGAAWSSRSTTRSSSRCPGTKRPSPATLCRR